MTADLICEVAADTRPALGTDDDALKPLAERDKPLDANWKPLGDAVLDVLARVAEFRR